MRLADEDNLYKLYLAYNAFAESFGQNEAAEAAFEAALDTRIQLMITKFIFAF